MLEVVAREELDAPRDAGRGTRLTRRLGLLTTPMGSSRNAVRVWITIRSPSIKVWVAGLLAILQSCKPDTE
jgi:hypothetical protein